MNSEDIEKFLDKNAMLNKECVQIKFRQRDSIFGLFVKDNDYAYLKAKNFWRIDACTRGFLKKENYRFAIPRTA